MFIFHIVSWPPWLSCSVGADLTALDVSAAKIQKSYKKGCKISVFLLASFGTLSKLYYNFSDKKLKKRVARQFNLPQHEVLESWMRSVTVLRNCCAHHSRLWNRYFSNAPQMKASLRGAWVNIEGVDANKVYAIFCCIAYWLDSMGYGLNFKNEHKSLLVSYPQVDPTAMGFPDNWITEPLWR